MEEVKVKDYEDLVNFVCEFFREFYRDRIVEVLMGLRDWFIVVDWMEFNVVLF